MSLEIGVFLPTSTPDPAVPIIGDIKRAARSAEELGLDGTYEDAAAIRALLGA